MYDDETGLVSRNNEYYEIKYNPKLTLKTQLLLDTAILKCKLLRKEIRRGDC